MEACHIAEYSLLAYENILNKGKPNRNLNEWTTFASITLSNMNLKSNPLTLICMATGTKCVGYNEYDQNGTIIHDSHAEVLCRRALLRYLYGQINLVKNNKPSIFVYDSNTEEFKLKDGLDFHMFITQPPCGDASIYPMEPDSPPPQCELNIKNKKENCYHLDSRTDIHRTGAKCLPHPELEPDMLLPKLQYHNINLLRTKPGRGYRSLSMSCSDKIMRWNILGLQGGLLFNILQFPIYLKTLIICGKNSNLQSIERAVLKRMNIQDGWSDDKSIMKIFRGANMKIIQLSHIEFPDAQKRTKTETPSPNSVIYCEIPFFYEILHSGYPQGTTKKARNEKYSQVCKKKLLIQYKETSNISEKMGYTHKKHIESIHYNKGREHFMMKAKTWANKSQFVNSSLSTN